jgi:hypothetical protein
MSSGTPDRRRLASRWSFHHSLVPGIAPLDNKGDKCLLLRGLWKTMWHLEENHDLLLVSDGLSPSLHRSSSCPTMTAARGGYQLLAMQHPHLNLILPLQ